MPGYAYVTRRAVVMPTRKRRNFSAGDRQTEATHHLIPFEASQPVARHRRSSANTQTSTGIKATKANCINKMLQWMGGSRRKVNTSRKSMHNKQKHYFEQRKRQQQTTGLDNHIHDSSKRAHYPEEPRSLDILSFLNLATVAQQGYSSHNSCFQQEILLPDKCSAAITENASATQSLSNKVEGYKTSASSCKFSPISTHLKSEEKQEDIQDEVSVLDLLNDDNKKIDCRGRVVPESHVAFSVGGLGNVGMETPAHSPRTQIRSFVSPLRMSKQVQNSANLRSMSYDLGIELSAAMCDTEKPIHGHSAGVACKQKGTFEKENRTSMKFIDSCIYSDVLDDLSDCFGSGNENFQECRNELWECKFFLKLKIGSFMDSLFDLPSWSFSQKEDLRDIISSSSEESCSSTAVGKGKSYDILSHLTQLKESKKIHSDDLDISLVNLKGRKKNHMDELDMNIDVSSPVQRIPDPDCIFPFKEDFPSGKLASDSVFWFQKFDRKVKCYLITTYCLNLIFNLLAAPVLSPRTDFTRGRSKSNIPVDHESFYDFNFENNISGELSGFAFRPQKPHAHTQMSEGCLPYSFSAGDSQHDTQLSDSMRQRNASKTSGESEGISINLENKILSEKSLYSLSERKNNNEAPSERLELNKRKASSCSSKAYDPPEEAEVPWKTKEVSELQTYINDKVSLDPSDIRNKESLKENLGSEVTLLEAFQVVSDMSYQVLLERYVLQLLCVQKVLLEA
ncbi:LOW QUALITY PROTEIN: uncharacterized protein LOC103989894 [Musa acuminata AAA Group]|uniref:LOW QUALITY PROTEIN: uncharacterized protein LOC103989894 n=1 Tax=Musa acuminata AAA Group TaxID=214697 RepID=UPI0031DD4B55